MNKVNKRYPGIFILFAVLVLSFVVSTSLGSVNVPFGNTVRIVIAQIMRRIPKEVPEIQYNIIVKLRIPRVFLGMIVGAALSISGLVFQALLKNPLADPYTLGVSAGASFGAGVAIFLSYTLHVYFRSLVPVFAFVGGVLTIFLVYGLARTKGRVHVLTIILSGVIVSYLFSSGLVLVMSLLGDRSAEIVYWLMGSLSGYHRFLPVAAIVVVVLLGFIFLFYRDLDLLSLGDEQANSLGVNTERIRLVLFAVTSLITSTAVALTGTIGFVGLIVPHSMRLLFGPKHKQLIPTTVVAGAAFLPLSDTLARIVPGILFESGMEIPVGVVTALIGSPFFVFLLIRGKRRLWF
ncbi:MAG: iron ABC transporter permease [Spirochaetota bacterium]|nr:MAG: iron ABC transporter permease [Spirochaetota bacterium]